MQVFEVGAWTLRVGDDATKAAYARISGPHTAGCTVISCANFAANRENAFPVDAQNELEQLGVDWRKEVYVSHTGGVHESRYHYVGFFLLLGESLTDVHEPSGGAPRPHHWVNGQTSSSEYVHSLIANPSLPYFASDAFQTGRPLLRCWFSVSIPWTIDAPYTGP